MTTVCIFAHPDDEAFGPGGTIATLAQTQDVHIICATRGGAANGPANLTDIRSSELIKSAEILGVKDVIFLDFPDGGLCNNNYHQIADAVRAHLERIKPLTLLTFEPHGVSGHIDHITMTMVTSYLFERLDYAKKLMYFCQSEDQMKIIREVIPDYFVFFPPGYLQSQIDETINTEAVWEIQERAIRQHGSQHDDIDAMIKIYNQLPKEEHFLVWKKE